MSERLLDRLRARCRELGFAAVGVVEATPLDQAAYFDRWIADGHHAEMGYMENHRSLRVDPSQLEPGTRSVVVVAMPYAPRRPEQTPTNGIARYALTDDYHDVMRDRLRALTAFLQAETGREVHGRPAVDSAPLLERNLAARAGLGWQGKSSMLISQSLGTYTLLGELLVDVALPTLIGDAPDRCGRCRRCIEVCPTGAIVADRVVDARRCISYLTIEHRGPIPRALRPALGDHLFGCDLCQEVCPWNRRAAEVTSEPALSIRPEVLATRPEDLLTMDQATFSRTFRRSPIKRAKRRGMARNAAIVLGNRGDRGAIPLLVEVARTHDEPLARGHAAWALGALGAGELAKPLLADETDPYVCEELRHTIDTPSP